MPVGWPSSEPEAPGSEVGARERSKEKVDEPAKSGRPTAMGIETEVTKNVFAERELIWDLLVDTSS